jgi:hypothetical protein
MTPDDIDQILSSNDLLEPASGFVMSVMERVHQQADQPPSPAFPWVRFSIGLIACLVLAATGSMLLLKLKPILTILSAPLAFLGGVAPELGYAVAVVLISVGLVSHRKLRSTA